MLTPQLKYALKVIFVIIVIAGLMASYIFTGVSSRPQSTTEQPAAEGFNFTGPTEEPTVSDPAGAPSANGPASPPPGSSL